MASGVKIWQQHCITPVDDDNDDNNDDDNDDDDNDDDDVEENFEDNADHDDISLSCRSLVQIPSMIN